MPHCECVILNTIGKSVGVEGARDKPKRRVEGTTKTTIKP